MTKIFIACMAFALIAMLVACTVEGYLVQRKKNRDRRLNDYLRRPL